MENKQMLNDEFEKVWKEWNLPDSLRGFCREWFGKGSFGMYELMKNDVSERVDEKARAAREAFTYGDEQIMLIVNGRTVLNSGVESA